MIEVITGPMFCGKTEELIRRARRAEIGRKTVAVIKHKFDDRYDHTDVQWVASHSGNKITSASISSSKEIEQYHFGWDVLCIDEAQFFDLALIDVVEKFSYDGVRVILAGLDMTFRREAFGPMPFLLAIANTVDKLTAVCHVCGDDAGYTQRLVNGKAAPFDGPTVQVGALETYEARCLYCFEVG